MKGIAMSLYQSKLYMEDIHNVGLLDLPWEKLKGKSIMLSGATGLLGSFLVDVIMEKNISDKLDCTVYALGRNEKRARERFSKYVTNEYLNFISCDVELPIGHDDIDQVDYVLHLASNTHPVAYATDPIGTIMTNIVGLRNMLDFAVGHHANRFLFASSVEIYGENRGDVEKFDESYLGYIDCNTLRAGYTESKRCGEALCQAYKKQQGLDIIIPRLSRVYGPTMLLSDTKASSQFILKAVSGEDIVLKSEGNQCYSYTYVADAVSGLLTVLLKGEIGGAYNIADADITLKAFAQYCADAAGTKIVFDLPDASEAAGYSKATKACLATEKIEELGWKAKVSIPAGIKRTIDILNTKYCAL